VLTVLRGEVLIRTEVGGPRRNLTDAEWTGSLAQTNPHPPTRPFTVPARDPRRADRSAARIERLRRQIAEVEILGGDEITVASIAPRLDGSNVGTTIDQHEDHYHAT
jgi:hypothetical protein